MQVDLDVASCKDGLGRAMKAISSMDLTALDAEKAGES